MARLATRLVVCVDGTSYDPSSGSVETNVHRICSAVQPGICTDSSLGETFSQIVTYLPTNLLGQGYLNQIQDVYESCSKLSPEQDEVWLFGFGRGAFVVRAVAGLLANFGSMASAGQPEYGKDFKKLLKDMEVFQGRSNLRLGPTTGTRPPPRIQFLGVFDTIKTISDDLFDISFNRSIRHMRQALALHEDRKSLTPERLYPEEFYGTALKDYGRSFVQAYFIGQHSDIGGSAKYCGLALYPYQWMLFEARQCGLVVDMEVQANSEYRRLLNITPKLKNKNVSEEDDALWNFTTGNGLSVTMQDFRAIHGISGGEERSYAVKLTSPKLGAIMQKKSRDPFTAEGYLRGYCDWAPQGTIIHPSVYFLLDEHINISLETKELKLQRHIEDWRHRMIGDADSTGANGGIWLDDDDDSSIEPGAIRILVCGNTGVGKSTLINKTFGVDVTQSSHRARGIHDVHEEITWEGRPDLIVHDSGGFEAGTDNEFHAIEAFLREKSAAEDVLSRVHLIWLCIDINSTRTRQTATEKLFLAVSKYAKDVPIVVVATKKDDLMDIEFGTRRKMLKKEGRPFDMSECERYAEEKLQERIDTIRSEMESVAHGRLDACIAVSQDDDESIANLSKMTSHVFDSDSVRLLYVRAQVTRIDLKIEMAQAEIMRRYRKLVRRIGATNFAPLGATITRKVSVTQVTKSVMNCFGLPTVTTDVAMEALKANSWSTFGSNIQLLLSEGFQLFGLSLTGITFGSPLWLITGSLNAAHIIPTTCRLFLIMACDLTLVLARSFKEATFRARGQPNEKDVGAAARNYTVRGYSQHVHRDIKKLIPRKNPKASFKADAVQRGVEDLFIQYKDKLMEDVDLPFNAQETAIENRWWDDTSTEADSIFLSDVKEANAAMAELEAKGQPPIAELDGTKPMAELPGDSCVSELAGISLDSGRVELEGSTTFSKM